MHEDFIRPILVEVLRFSFIRLRWRGYDGGGYDGGGYDGEELKQMHSMFIKII